MAENVVSPRWARDDYRRFLAVDGIDVLTPNAPSRPATVGRAVVRSMGLAALGGCGLDGEALRGAASMGL